MKLAHVQQVEARRASGYSLKQLFGERDVAGGRTAFGTVLLAPGARIPQEGISLHNEDEYSLVLKGSIVIQSGDVTRRIEAGWATLIPAGEAHWVLNDGEEEAEVVWALVRR
jgi:quercetin dioxygenase-like cupin family protein